ncbi:MAG: UPF0182 family protein [Planctomycetota bacterium]|nr:UPF0182 family protein [Planctomycetota bacterium]
MTNRTRLIIFVVVVGAVFWASGKVAVLYADYLWFQVLGYQSVFTTELWAKVVLGVSVFLLAALWLACNAFIAGRLSPGRYIEIKGLPWVIPSERFKRLLRLGGAAAILVAAFTFGTHAADYWYAALQFLYGQSFEWTDPILGYDAGFYVFTFPVLVSLKSLAMMLIVLGAIAAGVAYLAGGAIAWPGEPITRPAAVHLGILGSLLLVAIGFGYWLDRFELLFGSRGAVFGAGYVDANVRMRVLSAMSVLSIVAAVQVLGGVLLRRRRLVYAAVIGLVALHAAGVVSYPTFVQRFTVEPNELTCEGPFLENNITATRFAYGLADVEVQPYSASGTLSLADVRGITGTIENVRIWDWRVLLETYNQIESLRPYYHFNDVDVDRYHVSGQYRQTTLSVRELEPRLLNEESRTWVNLHLLYTHGYGLVMSPVNAVTAEGMPDLWIGNIPPQSKVPIQISQPGIYFGELTRDEVYVKTTQKEFDYPLGDENRYTEYSGKAGVDVGTLSRQVLFAYYFGDWNILFTNSFKPESRILWRRQVHERLKAVAPFFEYDRDAYPVVCGGRIVWIVDTYTRTGLFPYSSRARNSDSGLNYIRNPVKAVVDAYDGTVTFYVVDRQEPLVLVARTIFPSLFRDLDEMPEELRAHLRYPIDLFEVQAEQYLAYHMMDPQIFYNKEDLWQRPNHVFEGRASPIAAYYFIMTLPGEAQPEYLVMLPFTPARKDNMVGWLAGRCDGKEYGKLLCYTFPKDRLIFGPNQVEARINQNDEISPQLTLWNQHGSRVIRGNLLVLPVGDSILYIEPLYLKSENAPLPELKRVIASYQDRIAMRNTLDEALAAVFGAGPPSAEPPAAQPPSAQPPAAQPPSARPPGPAQELPGQAQWLRARELFEKADRQLRSGDWAGYGATMKELRKVIAEGAAAAQGK